MGRAPSHVELIFIVIATIALGAPAAAAQPGSGALTGMVHDQTGAAISGATIAATDVATNSRRDTISNSSGLYTLAGLVPGDYQVAVSVAGFRPLSGAGAVPYRAGRAATAPFGIPGATR